MTWSAVKVCQKAFFIELIEWLSLTNNIVIDCFSTLPNDAVTKHKIKSLFCDHHRMFFFLFWFLHRQMTSKYLSVFQWAIISECYTSFRYFFFWIWRVFVSTKFNHVCKLMTMAEAKKFSLSRSLNLPTWKVFPSFFCIFESLFLVDERQKAA